MHHCRAIGSVVIKVQDLNHGLVADLIMMVLFQGISRYMEGSRSVTVPLFNCK
jgi:hypothetical protein